VSRRSGSATGGSFSATARAEHRRELVTEDGPVNPHFDAKARLLRNLEEVYTQSPQRITGATGDAVASQPPVQKAARRDSRNSEAVSRTVGRTRGHLTAAGNLCWRLALQWVRNRVREWRHCRDCGDRVSVWNDCCPHCGSGTPTKISVSSSIVMGISFVLAVLLVVKVYYK
jgi:hypothetical protein